MNLPKPLSSLYYFIRVLSTYLSIDSSALMREYQNNDSIFDYILTWLFSKNIYEGI